MRTLLITLGIVLLGGCGVQQPAPADVDSPRSTLREGADQNQALEAQHTCVVLHKYADGRMRFIPLVDRFDHSSWQGERVFTRTIGEKELKLSFKFELQKNTNGKDAYGLKQEGSVFRKVEREPAENGVQVTGDGEGWGNNGFVEYDGTPAMFSSDEHGETWLMSREDAVKKRDNANETPSPESAEIPHQQ